MNKPCNFSGFAAIGLVALGFALMGCNSAPDLTKTAAQALIQAEYDKRPAEGVIVMVDRVGLKQGLDAHYWKLTKVYPNNRWADYILTPEGKKALTLNGGGDVIQWRPDADGAAHFFVTTVAANHPRVHDVRDPQDDVVANVPTAKSTSFVESVDFSGVPQPLQDMAHNPGNTLSAHRQVDFALEAGVWKVHLIR